MCVVERSDYVNYCPACQVLGKQLNTRSYVDYKVTDLMGSRWKKIILQVRLSVFSFITFIQLSYEYKSRKVTFFSLFTKLHIEHYFAVYRKKG